METGTVYADVLALINFSMDFAALRITSSVLKLKPRLWRSIAGASVGALYSFAALLLNVGGFLQIPADAAAALAICLIAYGAGNVFRWLTASGLFFTVGLIMGGAMTALYSRAGDYAEYLAEGGNVLLAEGALDGKTFIILCAASAAVTALAGKLISHVRRKKSCTIDVACAGKSARLFCVCDSGNLVQEPLSGLPVVFLCEASASFLPVGILAYLKTGDPGGCERTDILRVVPIATVDGSTLKYAVRCDRIKGDGGEEYEAVIALSATVPAGADGLAPAAFCGADIKRRKKGRDRGTDK